MNKYEIVRAELRERPRKWLVTGAAGFIGSNLVEELLRLGQHVVGLDNFATGYRSNVEEVMAIDGGGRYDFIEGDIRDLGTCRQACEGVDFVLHQAALGSVPRSINDPLATHDTNVNGFMNMLLAARDAGVRRFVFASSSSVYGDDPGLPKVESRTGMPLSPYAVSKRTGELYAHTFHQHYGLSTVGLRYFNVFGKRQDPNGVYAAVIPKWIATLLDGETCIINGDGETSRDFCFVDNVIQANILSATCINEVTGRVYNVAYGDRTTLNELFTLIINILLSLNVLISSTKPFYTNTRPGDIRNSLADISSIRRYLGYEPSHNISTGLMKVLPWYVQRYCMHTKQHTISM